MTRLTGTVSFFNMSRGFGHVFVDGTNELILLRVSELFPSRLLDLVSGDYISFTVVRKAKRTGNTISLPVLQPYAVDIEIIRESAQPRPCPWVKWPAQEKG